MTKATWTTIFLLALVWEWPSVACAQSVEWRGASDCIDVSVVEGELSRLGGEALHVHVLVESRPERASARVWRGDLRRELESESCAQLQRSLLLVLLLFPPPDEEQAPQVSAERPPIDETATADAPDEDGASLVARPPNPLESPPTSGRVRSSSSLWLSLGLDLDFGSMPRASVAPSLGFTLERKRLRVSVTGIYRPTVVESELEAIAMRGGQIELLAGGVVWKSPEEHWTLALLSGGSVGVLRVEARGPASQPDATRVVQWNWDTVLGVDWTPAPWLRIHAHAGFGVALLPARYEIRGLGVVAATSNLLVRAGFSLEVRFWSRKSPAAATVD